MIRMPQQTPPAEEFTLIPGLTPEVGTDLILSGLLILVLFFVRRGMTRAQARPTMKKIPIATRSGPSPSANATSPPATATMMTPVR